MNLKKVTGLIGCFILLAGLIIFYFKPNNIIAAQSSNEEGVAVTRQSNLYIEMTEEQLYGYADIVVAVQVKRVSEPMMIIHNIGTEDKSIIYKDFLVIVKEACKGSKDGEEIIIRVPGGEIDKKVFISDCVTPDTNKEQFLFLKRYQWSNSHDTTYDILGGPQGKYLIDNGKAIGFKKSKDIDSFKNELKSYKEKHGNKITLPPGFLE